MLALAGCSTLDTWVFGPVPVDHVVGTSLRQEDKAAVAGGTAMKLFGLSR